MFAILFVWFSLFELGKKEERHNGLGSVLW